MVGIPRGGFTPDETDAVNGVREDGDNINTLWLCCMDPLSAEIVVFQHPCDPVRHGSRPALGELRAASNARNGMQLDDDDNMQVDSQGAAVVEMLGGEPGVGV